MLIELKSFYLIFKVFYCEQLRSFYSVLVLFLFIVYLNKFRKKDKSVMLPMLYDSTYQIEIKNFFYYFKIIKSFLRIQLGVLLINNLI